MERVNLDFVYGKTGVARWRRGWVYGPFVSEVTVGRLADGRWFAERTGRGCTRRDTQQGACVYAGPDAKHYARATARRWMRTMGGEWETVALRAPVDPGR